MRLSTTFRRAHDLVATGEEPYSCDAILRASAGRAPGALLWYKANFRPADDSPMEYWLRNTGLSKAERIQWRLTALAFAAAITKSEGN